ncbi:MAG: hypothetical protein ACPGSI_18645 [Pikeienuella sp.]
MFYDEKSGQVLDAAQHAKLIERQTMFGGAANPRMGGMATFMSGVPLVGEFFDEGMGKAYDAATGAPEGYGQEVVRELREQYTDENPNEALATQIGGGVVGSLPAAAMGVPLISKVPGAALKATAGAGAGGALGALEGATAGYGSGETPEDRSERAVTGAGVGGALGLGLGGLAPIVGVGVKSLARRIQKTDIGAIADELGISRKAATVLRRYAANDDLEGARRAIDMMGDDAMLADAGMGMGQALDDMTQTGGRALTAGTKPVAARAAKAGPKIRKTLDMILGEPEGMETAARSIAKRTAGVRQKAYDAAYASPINYASKAGRNIEGVLSRVPKQILRKAINSANDSMQIAGLKNQQILADIADDGTVAFREMPNVRQLDTLKRKLGEIAEGEVDNVGRITGHGIEVRGLASDLRDAIKVAVPSYSRALKLGGDKISEDAALDLGKDILTNRVSKFDVAKWKKAKPSKEAVLAAKRGLREQIETTLDNVRATLTQPDVDPRQAYKAVADFSSEGARAKVNMLLGPSEANKLFRDLDNARGALELAAVVGGNSKTAIRTAGREAFEATTAPNALTSLAQFKPGEAVSKITAALTGATDDAAMAARAKIAAEVADVLTRTRGKDAERALKLIGSAMKGQPLKDETAATIARAVEGSLLVGGYQSVRQPQLMK